MSMDAAVEEQRRDFRGMILLPQDSGFADRLTYYNAACLDKLPRVIFCVNGASDVVKAIQFGKTHKLSMAIKNSGLNSSGESAAPLGLLIDVGLMSSISIDPKKEVAYIGGGALSSDVNKESRLFDLTLPVGEHNGTGIAGLVAHGGTGILSRSLGLLADSLVEAEIVTSECRVVRTNKDENSGLFWALRGAGHHLGVVTSMVLKLHRVGAQPGMAHGGAAVMSDVDTTQYLGWFRDVVLPSEDGTVNAWLHFGYNQFPTAIPYIIHLGGKEAAERDIGKVKDLGRTLYGGFKEDHIGVLNDALDDLLDSMPSTPRRQYWTSIIVDNQAFHDNDFIEAFVFGRTDMIEHETLSASSIIMLIPIGGAISKVAPNSTPVIARAPHQTKILFFVGYPDIHQANEASGLVESVVKRFSKWDTGRRVICDTLETEEEERQSYGPDNWEKLKAIRAKWDPEGIFSHRQAFESY